MVGKISILTKQKLCSILLKIFGIKFKFRRCYRPIYESTHGATLTNNAKWYGHVNSIMSSASKILGIIRRIQT